MTYPTLHLKPSSLELSHKVLPHTTPTNFSREIMTISPSTTKENHRLTSAPTVCVAVCVAECVAECVVVSNTKELEQILVKTVVKTVRVVPTSEFCHTLQHERSHHLFVLQCVAVSCSELQ